MWECGKCLPTCPGCVDPIDPFGDHFVACKKDFIYHRHNALRDQLCTVLTSAGISHAKEVLIPPGGGRVNPFALERPADILLIGWDRGRDVAVDLTVSHPLAPHCHPLSLEKSKRFLPDAEGSKRSKEGSQCQSAGWGFHPAAFSPWGGLGPGAKTLWFAISKKLSPDLQGWPKKQAIKEQVAGVSLALARALAKQLGLRCKVADHCSDSILNLLPPPSC